MGWVFTVVMCLLSGGGLGIYLASNVFIEWWWVGECFTVVMCLLSGGGLGICLVIMQHLLIVV